MNRRLILFFHSVKQRQGSASSGGFSEFDEGGEFGGPGVKIDEWQAGWNVTNAIQVKRECSIV